jgi:site-specific DNA-methyltransferase (adenine-specific)
VTPYYQEDGITIFHADCREVLPTLGPVDLVLTDPPYGINYQSGKTGHNGGTPLPGICGDQDSSLRDFVLASRPETAAIVFGTWKVAKPDRCRGVLTWEKGDHVGMGDLTFPWKPNTEEIYIIGQGFSGYRGSSVIRCNAPVSWNSTTFGRLHPHEKPTELIAQLLMKHQGTLILDPFMGSGTTLRAAKDLGRRCIGIEIEEKYCEIAAKRLAQGVLAL